MNHSAPNPLHKPVLDQAAFHQLLAAAYTLQQQNGATDAKRGFPKTPAGQAIAELGRQTVESASSKSPQPKPAQLIPPVQPAAPSTTHYTIVRRRIIKSDEFFWGIAPAVAMAAVSVLLLGASINYFSPLPAGLEPSSETIQHQAAKPIMTSLDQSSGVSDQTVMTEPDAATEGSPIQPTATDQRPRGNPSSSHKKTVNRKRHSHHAREADFVAPNTIVRYGRQSPAPLEQAKKYP